MPQYDSFYDENGPAVPFDYNPVHAIWYLLTEIGMPDSRLNESSFLAAAITVYNEGLGISAKLNNSIDAKSTIQQILHHIQGVLLWGTDGKFHIVLLRKDYLVENLPVVNENVVLGEPMIDRGSWRETYGEIKIQYSKRIYPPAGLRYVQEAIEVLREGDPRVHSAQEAIEVLRKGQPKIHNVAEVVEVARVNIFAAIDDIELFVVSSTSTTVTTTSITQTTTTSTQTTTSTTATTTSTTATSTTETTSTTATTTSTVTTTSTTATTTSTTVTTTTTGPPTVVRDSQVPLEVLQSDTAPGVRDSQVTLEVLVVHTTTTTT